VFVIRHTFSVLNGIGEKMERSLWQRGIFTWDDFLGTGEIEGISAERKQQYDIRLREMAQALDAADAAFLSRAIKRRDHWRLFESFRSDAVCLDIETNGLPAAAGGYTTVVGLYDGHDCTCLVHGDNLSAEALNRSLHGYRYLITFYGAGFDVPFLLRTMPGVRFDIPHFDLCFAARRLEIEGGLKRLEERFGIVRHEDVRGLDGYDAVKLWEQYRRGNAGALSRLLIYNREDTRNLLAIAGVFYAELRKQTGFDEIHAAWRACAAA
jgi:uncharacterized protein YprB with RNaseH-like and TPR domain